VLKIVGFGLLGLFALMVIPSGVSSDVNPMFYGTANMVLADASGNVLLAQTVHNLITDEGENFIIDQVFDTATTELRGDARVGAICIIENSESLFAETTTSALTNNLNNPSGNHCKSTAVITAIGDSKAVTDPTIFTAGTDFTAGETISGILICVKGDQADNDFAECSTPTNAVALAALNLTNVTAIGTDTVTITYTFNIETDGS